METLVSASSSCSSSSSKYLCSIEEEDENDDEDEDIPTSVAGFELFVISLATPFLLN